LRRGGEVVRVSECIERIARGDPGVYMGAGVVSYILNMWSSAWWNGSDSRSKVSLGRSHCVRAKPLMALACKQSKQQSLPITTLLCCSFLRSFSEIRSSVLQLSTFDWLAQYMGLIICLFYRHIYPKALHTFPRTPIPEHV
jgi:hypothetical protein